MFNFVDQSFAQVGWAQNYTRSAVRYLRLNPILQDKLNLLYYIPTVFSRSLYLKVLVKPGVYCFDFNSLSFL